MSKRGQLVETRKRLLAQIKAHEKQGSSKMFEAMGTELQDLLDHQIAEIEARIEQIISIDQSLATTVGILHSVPGISPVASTMLIAEMQELGQISANKQQRSQALRPLHTIAEPCAENGLSAVEDDCTGM